MLFSFFNDASNSYSEQDHECAGVSEEDKFDQCTGDFYFTY